jgi:hypothetical protein
MIHHLVQLPSGRTLLLLTTFCVARGVALSLHLLASTQQSSTSHPCTQRTAPRLAWYKHHWRTWARRPCLPTTVDTSPHARERKCETRDARIIAHCACPFIFERRATERPFRASKTPEAAPVECSSAGAHVTLRAFPRTVALAFCVATTAMGQ